MAVKTPLAIRLRQVRKEYRLYASAQDRLKEALHPLRRKYHTLHHALKSLDLDVEQGRTLGILGRNGAGKSTLLKLITGTLTPTFGTVETTGRIASLLELGAGFNTELTGTENIFFSGAIMGLSRREMQARVDEIVAFADIGEYISQPVRTYSSGMFARLAFAVNTCVDPDIFIVDEALAVGDAAFVHRCMLRFHDMQKQGKTILLVTHDATVVKQLCHRALWLEKGGSRMEGEARDVADAYIMDIFGQTESYPLHMSNEKDGGTCSCVQVGAHETRIPNIDKRIGDGRYVITGINLYSQNYRPIKALESGTRAVLRVSFTAFSSENDSNISVGFIIRDFRGNDIASTNTFYDGFKIPRICIEKTATIDCEFCIPLLHPGVYSITSAISTFNNDNDFTVCDKIFNAIHFEIISEKRFGTLLRLEADYKFACDR